MKFDKNIPFVLQYREIFSNYLSVLGRIMVKAPRNEMYRLLN